MPIRLILLLAVAGTAIAIATAVAATPESGKVSKAAPIAKWSGATTSGAVTANAWNNDESFPCQIPSCDSYALEVADAGGDLVIKINIQAEATSGSGTASVRITDPAGKVTIASGDSNTTQALKIVVKNAAVGTYTLDNSNSYICCGSQEYLGVAELTFPGAAPAPAPGAAPPPAAPAPAEVKMTVKASKASARKVNKTKKLTASLTTTGPVSGVRVLLVKGKTQVGVGTLAKVDGKAKVTVKIKKKLKPGTYGLAAGGTDAAGRAVQAGVKFKVKK